VATEQVLKLLRTPLALLARVSKATDTPGRSAGH
jgi:hypothetical protein